MCNEFLSIMEEVHAEIEDGTYNRPAILGEVFLIKVPTARAYYEGGKSPCL